MTDQQTSTNEAGGMLGAAKRYRAQGFAVVPTSGKDAFLTDWQEQGTPPKDDAKYWRNGRAYNVGIVLGRASGGLADIDRDCDLPNRIDKMFLPDTLMSGREKRPHTHSWYYAPGLESRALYDANGKKFLEVRSDGCQTVVSPSKHPDDGDRYVWHPETGSIATTVDTETLTRAVNEYATALLLALHMPPIGSRHDYALASAGFLLRNDRLDVETAERVLLGAWHAAGADGHRKTIREVQDVVTDTAERLASGEEVKGGGALDELVEELPKRISRIWGWSRDARPERVEQHKNGKKDDPGPTKRLADAICEGNYFAQDSGGKLYRYNGGAYRKDAAKYIRRRVKELLEEWKETALWSSYRGDEVCKYIAADAPELWERPPFDEVNVQNGILDVFTRELREHSPDYLSPVQLPITYDAEAKCPAWEQYVEPCFPDDAPTLPYEIFASLITPYKATQKAVLLLGEGANGKSTSLAAMMRGVGRTNCTSVTLQALESNRFATARLVGKLANICPDLPSTHLQETSVFKALTGDEGQITAEYKHKDSFEFEAYCQLVFSANHPPKSSDASHAFYRRWVVAPFDKTFEGSEQLPREELDEMLAAPEELSGMLNKALDALPGLRRNGFTESPKMRAAWEEFRAMTDPVSVWLSRATVRDPHAYVVKKELHTAYNEHAERHGQTLTEKAFSQAVKRALPDVSEGQRTVGGVRKHCWLGLGLKSGDGDPPPGPSVTYGAISEHDIAQGAQGAQDYSTCNEKADTGLLGGNDSSNVGDSTHLCNKGNPVHPVQGVQDGGEQLDERTLKAVEALTYGNAPRKALEHYRAGDQDLDSLARSVMHYFARPRDDLELWSAATLEAMCQLSTKPSKGGEGAR